MAKKVVITEGGKVGLSTQGLIKTWYVKFPNNETQIFTATRMGMESFVTLWQQGGEVELHTAEAVAAKWEHKSGYSVDKEVPVKG